MESPVSLNLNPKMNFANTTSKFSTASDNIYPYEPSNHSDVWTRHNGEAPQGLDGAFLPSRPQIQSADSTLPHGSHNVDEVQAPELQSTWNLGCTSLPYASVNSIVAAGYNSRPSICELGGQRSWNPSERYSTLQSAPQNEPQLYYAASQTYVPPFQAYYQSSTQVGTDHFTENSIPWVPQPTTSGTPWHPLHSASLDPQGAVQFRARSAGDEIVVTANSPDTDTGDASASDISSPESGSGGSDLPFSRCKVCNSVVSKATRESDRKSNVTRHIRNQHRGLAKPTCTEPGCGGKTFARPDLLLRHQRSNHGTPPTTRILRRGSRASRGEGVARRRS